MARSFVQYTGDGSTTNFSFSFPYLSKDHIHAYVDGTEKSFDWNGSSTIILDPAPADGSTVEVRRITPADARVVNFQSASTLTEKSLDKAFNQDFYLVQEVKDASENAMTPVGGVWDAEGLPISNAGAPQDDNDLVTLGVGNIIVADAEAARDTAQTYRDQANSHEVQAGYSETLATRYATEAEDTSVVDPETGSDTGNYSAYHWAQKARENANSALPSSPNDMDFTRFSNSAGWIARTPAQVRFDLNLNGNYLPRSGGDLDGPVTLPNSTALKAYDAGGDAQALARITGNDVARYGTIWLKLRFQSVDTPLINGNQIWHAGNMGAGSGLDADSVDGRNASQLWHPGNDGSGSGLDADKVDGKHASQLGAMRREARFYIDTGGWGRINVPFDKFLFWVTTVAGRHDHCHGIAHVSADNAQAIIGSVFNYDDGRVDSMRELFEVDIHHQKDLEIVNNHTEGIIVVVHIASLDP